MDDRTPEERSKNMSRIRANNTKIEVRVRQELFSRGYRFRKNDKRYPGKPDVVLPKYHTVIFINGCFWHHHANCKRATTPKSNTEYWEQKFNRNIENDKKHTKELQDAGWQVITIWECELQKDFVGTIDRIEEALKQNKVIDTE